MPKITVPLNIIYDSYQRTNSVWRTGEELGIKGQTVHRILQRNDLINDWKLAEDDKAKIEHLYREGFARGDGKLQRLCDELGVGKKAVCRYARKKGLTSYGRSFTEELAQKISERQRKWIGDNGHPRGMLGKKHTQEVKKRMGEASTKMHASLSIDRIAEIKNKMLRTKIAKGNLIPRLPDGARTWKSGWREVGDRKIYFRSEWEYNYALILDKRKRLGIITEWEYEPETFWFEKIKRGTRCYTPDFRVTWTDGGIEYHEVKGWMDSRSRTTLNRMRIYHPNVKMVLIDGKAYKAIMKRGI